MIRDLKLWREFERQDTVRLSATLTPHSTMQLFESMWQAAKSAGALEQSNPLAGVEIDIEVARTINRLQSVPHV